MNAGSELLRSLPSPSPVDVAVIGEGIAGLHAAGALLRMGKLVAIFEGEVAGGLVAGVSRLAPAPPGVSVSGPEWSAELALDNLERGARAYPATVSAVTHAPTSGFAVQAQGVVVHAAAVIVATGARLRMLDVPGAARLVGRGVSMCADCDGPLFRGETVVVVGAGESACQEALVLADVCAKVILVRRSPRFRATSELAANVLAHPRIEVMDATVEAIAGTDHVEAIYTRTHGTSGPRRLACAGVFPFVGVVPTYPTLPEAISRSAEGALSTDAQRGTTVPGVWAIGAVREGFPGRLTDAMQDALIAANSVARYRVPTAADALERPR